MILDNWTLTSIQNMTWNSELRFQQRPMEDLVVPDQGVLEKKHIERGLTWLDQYATNCFGPESQKPAGQRHLSWLIGNTEGL